MASWRFSEGDAIAADRHVLRLLGGGRRYEAYLAWDDHLRATVVAKLIRPDLVRDVVALRGLAAEAEALERLAHPMLVRSFGAQLTGERPHLVLELIEGPRLSTVIRRYGLSLEQIVPLALNLTSVLHYLAREGVTHLDVKPRNVIMAAGPRLIDLSVARTVAELRELRSPVGTDAYMAPEQCDPALFDQIGPASDVWGLGVTLYEALTGRRPFPAAERGATDGERYPQLVRHPPPLPDTVPASLAAPVLACLERRPADRPTAGELGDRLEPIAAALPRPRLGRLRPGARALMAELEAR